MNIGDKVFWNGSNKYTLKNFRVDANVAILYYTEGGYFITKPVKLSELEKLNTMVCESKVYESN